MPELNALSRRERQIMDVIFEFGSCSAHDVLNHIPEPPSYSSVRALLARLVEKGFISTKQDGNRHIYRANISKESARGSALKRLVKTFFKGSSSKAVSALLDMDDLDLSPLELDDLERKIARLKKNNQ